MAILSNEQKNLQKEQENLLTKQFAAARSKLGGVKRETQRQAGQSLNRLQAQTGSVGGSIEKAKQKAISDIGQQFGELETGLGGQEAQAMSDLKKQEQALLESAEGRKMQQDLLEFQKGSFAEQMKFQWAEFDENLKTNILNAAIALKDAGLKSQNEWSKIFGGLSGLYGDRVPASFAPIPEAQAAKPGLRGRPNPNAPTRLGG